MGDKIMILSSSTTITDRGRNIVTEEIRPLLLTTWICEGDEARVVDRELQVCLLGALVDDLEILSEAGCVGYLVMRYGGDTVRMQLDGKGGALPNRVEEG
jgi:hypothetical protein